MPHPYGCLTDTQPSFPCQQEEAAAGNRSSFLCTHRFGQPRKKHTEEVIFPGETRTDAIRNEGTESEHRFAMGGAHIKCKRIEEVRHRGPKRKETSLIDSADGGGGKDAADPARYQSPTPHPRGAAAP